MYIDLFDSYWSVLANPVGIWEDSSDGFYQIDKQQLETLEPSLKNLFWTKPRLTTLYNRPIKLMRNIGRQ